MHQHIKLTGGTLRYRDEGPADGPVLVFAHGFLVDGDLWGPVVERLRGSMRCIRPELPLGSHTIPMDADADLTPRAVAAMIAEFLAALDLRDVTLVGNDSGGAISQVVAAEHPERLGRLVLVSCDAFEDFPPKLFRPLIAALRGPRSVHALLGGLRFRPMRRTPLAYGWVAKHPLSDALTDQWVAPLLRDAGVRRDIAKLVRGATPAVTLDAAARLSAFDRPTLLAWAAEDRFFSPDLAHRLARILPDARVELLDDCWTFVPLDQPARLAELLGAFVTGTQPAGNVPAGTKPG